MIFKIIAAALVLALLPLPATPARAAGEGPTHWPYIGIVYREPGWKVVGLGGSAGGYLAWFVYTGPPHGANIVGGFRSRHAITLAPAPGGGFLLAVPDKAGTRIDTYAPGLNKITSSVTISSARIAFGVWNPVRVGIGGHLWMLGVAGHAVYLYCVAASHGQIIGRFRVPQGSNGATFWPSGTGAVVGVAKHQSPDAVIGSLYYVTPRGTGRRIVIPRCLRPFPLPATVRRGVLLGVNARWQFMKADIGPMGRIKLVLRKRLAVNRKVVASHPGYFFDLGHDRAVVSSLGDWDAKTDRYLHRYLFLISEETGMILRKMVAAATWQPICAAGGNVFLLDRGKIVAFTYQFHRSVVALHINPSPRAIQAAASP